MSVPVLGVRLVVLWTDGLLYALLGAALITLRGTRGSGPLRAAWAHLFARPSAMAAAVILTAFGAVALLDSVHFQERVPGAGPARYATAIESVLDVVCAPLRLHEEQTYSAPFALVGLTRVSRLKPGGGFVRVFPRLRWGGRGIQAGTEGADLWRRAAVGALDGMLGWLFFALPLILFRRWRRPHRSPRPAVAWRTFWVTWAVLFVLTGIVSRWAVVYHVLGTDQVGIDVLFKALKSIRTGVLIGTVSTGAMLPFAVVFGLAAGFFGGWVDDVIQYLYTTLNSVPGVLLIAASVLSLDLFLAKQGGQYASVVQRADLRLLFLCLILGTTSWTGLCRLLRAETLKLRETEYVQCAVVLGERPLRILARHILPNVLHIVVITLALDFSGLVLAEAVLTYAGVGVDPSMYSWGNTINAARLELARAPVVWWDLAAAFGFMSVLVLAANLFADGIRDAFDPRSRTS